MSRIRIPVEPGQLVFAMNMVAQKTHVIRVEHTAYDDDVRGLSKFLSKEARQRKLSDIDPQRKGLLHARALCGVSGEQSTYGNITRYYWSATRDPSMENVCKGCMREWKKLGEPDIVAWDRSAKPEDAWPWELPFGWRVAEPEGHPWDCEVAADVERTKNDTGKVVGEHRVELRRWTRGRRIVRLVHHLDTDTYSARHWREGADPDNDDDIARGTLQYARQKCHELMARGGY